MVRLVSWFALVLWFCAAPALAQPGRGADDLDELRRMLGALAEKLERMESASPRGDGRVTEIGAARSPRLHRDPDKMVVRVYDVSDLFSVAPPYHALRESDLAPSGLPLFTASVNQAGPGTTLSGTGGMGGFYSVPSLPPGEFSPRPQVLDPSLIANTPAANRISLDDFLDAITGTIEPSMWDGVGGPASIATLGTTLIVSANEDMHEQITALLNLLRERWGSLRTIAVQAWWLWLTDEQLAALLPGEGKTDLGGGMAVFGAVEPAAWQRLLAAQGDGAAPGYRAALSCYNGQTVHVVAGGQQLTVAGWVPVLGGKDQAGAVAYQPQVRLIEEGAALQVTPTATRAGRFIVLDVHTKVNLADSPAASMGPPSPGAAGPAATSRIEWSPTPAIPTYAARDSADTPPATGPPTSLPVNPGTPGGSLPPGNFSYPTTTPPSTFNPYGVSPSPPVIVRDLGPVPPGVPPVTCRRLTTLRLSTTLRMPVDRTMLVGGMTAAARPDAGQPTLYLFVRATMQELRDDLDDGEALGGEAPGEDAPPPAMDDAP